MELTPLSVHKPRLAPGEPPVLLREVIAAAPAGICALDIVSGGHPAEARL